MTSPHDSTTELARRFLEECAKRGDATYTATSNVRELALVLEQQRHVGLVDAVTRVCARGAIAAAIAAGLDCVRKQGDTDSKQKVSNVEVSERDRHGPGKCVKAPAPVNHDEGRKCGLCDGDVPSGTKSQHGRGICTDSCLSCPPKHGSILYGKTWVCSTCGVRGEVTAAMRAPGHRDAKEG